MTVVEFDIRYQLRVGDSAADSFDFAEEVALELAELGVDNAPDEDTIVGWEADAEYEFVSADGDPVTVSKTYDEDAGEDAEDDQ